MKVTGETLSLISVFRDLDIRDRKRLAESMSLHRYAPQEIIITQDDESGDVFFIVSGLVRATAYAVSGKEVSYQDLAAGEMFGELSAIDNQPRSTHVVALEEVVVATISPEVYWAAMMKYPSVAATTLRRLTSLIRMHTERIFEYGTLGVNNRIHAEFLRMARDAGVSDGQAVIASPPTHAEIAARVATHREAVTRECRRLEALDLIEWHPGRHVIKDVERLAGMVKDVRGH